jgi:hypothetical protein
VNRTRRRGGRTRPPFYRRPPCLRHSGSPGQATSTNGHVELFFYLGTLFPRSVSSLAMPRTRNPRRLPCQNLRHPESCLTIFGGVPGGARYRAVVGF